MACANCRLSAAGRAEAYDPNADKPIQRSLTRGEVAMLQPLFRGSIQYARVRIHSRPRPTDSGGAVMIALDDDIYVGKSAPYAYSDDYSQVFDVQVFVHEMTHVWQSQNGHDGLWEDLRVGLARVRGVRETYAYNLADEDDLLDFNYEQQAEIMGDYFMRVNGRLAWDARGSRADYERVLARFLRDPYLRS